MARSINALIIDDESHVRSYLRLLLKEVGIENCEEAADGAAGLELIRRNPPGLVLLDLNMPGMGGLEVLKAIGEIDPDIPVVISTAQRGADAVEAAANLGAVGYVLKAGPRAEVLASIREVVDSLGDDAEGA